MARFRPVLLSCAAVLASVLVAGCGSTSRPTPTHVVAVFLDGFNHADMRQACTQIETTAYGSLTGCEQYFAQVASEGIFFGAWGGYGIVPHSAKTWTQSYQDGSVELATVKFEYAPTKGQKLTAHLRKRRGVWKIWWVG